jgi:hypothetical protein
VERIEQEHVRSHFLDARRDLDDVARKHVAVGSWHVDVDARSIVERIHDV